MPTVEERKLISFGGASLLVVLPKAWLDFYGDQVKKVIAGDDALIIAPEGYEKDARRLIALSRKGK